MSSNLDDMKSSLPDNAILFLDWSWSQIEPYFKSLTAQSLDENTIADWLADWSELSKLLDEAYWRLYDATAVDTADQGVEGKYKHFLDEIRPRAKAAEQKLKEQVSEVPQAVREATLEQYKKLVTNGMEVPDRFKPLLESAGSEADIDTVLDSIRDSQASRYPGLPTFGSEHSRKTREALANRLNENTTVTETDQEEDDPEVEDTRRVLRATMGR